ncbi:MAG: hypothetical protein HY320_08965 [Armatimonadetes bacterium]|nr:hypothetical protein [Armatimonadota bacterium]
MTTHGDDNTVVDFIHDERQGVRVNFELAVIQEYERQAWVEVAAGPGTRFSMLSLHQTGEAGEQNPANALRDGRSVQRSLEEQFPAASGWSYPALSEGELTAKKSETGQLRRVQHKIREKTQRDGQPIKFGPVQQGVWNVLVIDVSGPLSGMLDKDDFRLMTYGRRAVPDIMRMGVVGLFEPRNPLGSELQAEFEGNRYLRERVHALVFLKDDQSRWESPMDPEYHAMFLCNPALIPDESTAAPLLDVRRRWLRRLVHDWDPGGFPEWQWQT